MTSKKQIEIKAKKLNGKTHTDMTKKTDNITDGKTVINYYVKYRVKTVIKTVTVYMGKQTGKQPYYDRKMYLPPIVTPFSSSVIWSC